MSSIVTRKQQREKSVTKNDDDENVATDLGNGPTHHHAYPPRTREDVIVLRSSDRLCRSRVLLESRRPKTCPPLNRETIHSTDSEYCC